MNKFSGFFISFLILSGAASLQATETLPFYFGVGYGIARYVGDEVHDPIFLAGQKAEGDRGYYETYVGLDLGSFLSVEVNYAQFDAIEESYEYDTDINYLIDQYDSEHIEFDRFSLMAIAEYPITLGVSVYVTGGYAYYNFERVFFNNEYSSDMEYLDTITNGDHGLEYGFGAKWEIISRVSVRGQWSQSLMGDRKIESNRLSVEIHF